MQFNAFNNYSKCIALSEMLIQFCNLSLAWHCWRNEPIFVVVAAAAIIYLHMMFAVFHKNRDSTCALMPYIWLSGLQSQSILPSATSLVLLSKSTSCATWIRPKTKPARATHMFVCASTYHYQHSSCFEVIDGWRRSFVWCHSCSPDNILVRYFFFCCCRVFSFNSLKTVTLLLRGEGGQCTFKTFFFEILRLPALEECQGLCCGGL